MGFETADALYEYLLKFSIGEKECEIVYYEEMCVAEVC